VDRVMEGGIWSMYFVYLYENRVRERKGLNLTKVHYKRIWKHDNENPLFN
jgi:hypothetical protein